MVSEACQQYMQSVDAAATHTGPAQDVLSILDAAQKATEVQTPSDRRGVVLLELQHRLRHLRAVMHTISTPYVHAPLTLSSQCTAA